MDQATKPCSRCREVKLTEAFARRAASRDGLQSTCRSCMSGYNRDHHARNRVKVHARQRQRYLDNRDAEICRRQDYYRAHREEVKSKARQRYAADPQRWRPGAIARARARRAKYTEQDQRLVTQQIRAWRQANLERARYFARRWARNNPLKVRANGMARRARLLAAPKLPFTASQLRLRLSMFAGCWICGGPKESVDHVKPLSRGGAHMLANLRPACKICNSTKGNRWPYTPPGC